MSHLNLRIHNLGDPNAWPELANARRKEVELQGCTILEKGMTSGKTSLVFHAVVEGEVILFQMSAAMLETIMGTVRGAEQRWKERGE